jgi:uncharacterized low-complexity protein
MKAMTDNKIKPVAMAIGASFLASAVVPLASADVNPFAVNEMQAGYQLADSHKQGEGNCGEGKCGEEKKAAKEGNCGEGKKADKEGNCGEMKKADKEGSCGEMKKADKEGSCGGKK